MTTLIERVAPIGVAWHEILGDEVVNLFPGEETAVAKAVQTRRAEFITGRACARKAMQMLGAPVVSLERGEGGAPLWPPGVVGSITHCAGYRAAVVASSDAFASLGVDAEANAPLPPEIVDLVATSAEIEALLRLEQSNVHWDRLLFAAKETVYKAWFPLTRRWLEFHDVEVEITEGGHFIGTCSRAVRTLGLREFRGRWVADSNFIVALATVPARTPSSI